MSRSLEIAFFGTAPCFWKQRDDLAAGVYLDLAGSAEHRGRRMYLLAVDHLPFNGWSAY